MNFAPNSFSVLRTEKSYEKKFNPIFAYIHVHVFVLR